MFRDILARQAATYHKPTDRSKTVGASEIGMCLRRVWFSKNKIDYDPGYERGWGAAIRGNVHEQAFWVPALRKHFGKNLLFAGKYQRTLKSGPLSATPDGLVINVAANALAYLGVKDIGPSRCVVVENKTLDPRIAIDVAKSENMFQVQCQMGLIRETTKYKPDYAVICYSNASFFDDVTEFVEKFDPDVYDRAKKRAWRVMSAKKADELKPEAWIWGGKDCQYCPWAKRCAAIRGNVPEEKHPHGTVMVTRLDPQLIAEFADMAREERMQHSIASMAEEKQREIQHAIKERLREKGLNRIDENGIKIIWSQVKGRPSTDWTKLKEAATLAGVDVESYSSVGDPSDRLTITLNPMKGTRNGK